MRDDKYPAVYIIANTGNGTIYIGVTSALWNRIAALSPDAVTSVGNETLEVDR